MANKTDRKSTGRNKGSRNKITQVASHTLKGIGIFTSPQHTLNQYFLTDKIF